MTSLHLRSTAFVCAVFSGYLAAFMIIPALFDVVRGSAEWRVFTTSALLVGGAAAAVGLATYSRSALPISARFGFLLVNALWVTTALAGAIPFMGAPTHLSFTDAVFESVSALTTTGSTVVSGLDALPPGILFWRSFLQWIGGLGVIALGLFILPFLKIGGLSYLRIESSEKGERPFSRLVTYLQALVALYALMTLMCAILYALSGMSGFDAINHAMTTLSTGGFSTHDSSLGFYADKPLMLWVGTAFMFFGALPFSILILLALRGQLEALKDPQIKVFAGYCAAFIFGVAIYWTITADTPFGHSLTHSAFNFMSIITTTGYASGDYSLWGPFVVACAFMATFLGGCSGSTSGGIKAYRFVVMYKILTAGMRKLVYRHSVSTLRYGDQPIGTDVQAAVLLFVVSFFLLWAVLILMLSATGLDFVTASTGALTALTNVGPGLGTVIGPVGNFATLPDASKWVLSLAMLLGRLEILAVLVLLSPAFWRS
jgi:trk system potassium uptake protein TrkH